MAFNTHPPAAMPTDRGRCQDCGDDIVWAMTERGKKLPVNPHTDDRSTFVGFRSPTGTLRVRVPTEDNRADPWEHPYMPHVATCRTQQARRAATVPPAPAQTQQDSMYDNVLPFRGRR
jgi:hypothetical protein